MCDLWHFVPTVSHTHTFTSPLSSPTNHPPASSSSSSSSSTTTSSLLSSLSSPQLNITLSSVEEKLQLPHIARLISRRHVRGWEHFIQQVTCGRLRRSSFKVVLSTEACAWSSLDYFTECGGEGEREREIEKVCFGSEREGERKPERERERNESSWVFKRYFTAWRCMWVCVRRGGYPAKVRITRISRVLS